MAKLSAAERRRFSEVRLFVPTVFHDESIVWPNGLYAISPNFRYLGLEIRFRNKA